MNWDKNDDGILLVECNPVRGAGDIHNEERRRPRTAGLPPTSVVLKAAVGNVAALLSRLNANPPAKAAGRFAVDGARAAGPMPDTTTQTR